MGLFTTPWWQIDMEICWMMPGSENQYNWKKSTPMSLCPSLISHWLSYDWTWASQWEICDYTHELERPCLACVCLSVCLSVCVTWNIRFHRIFQHTKGFNSWKYWKYLPRLSVCCANIWFYYTNIIFQISDSEVRRRCRKCYYSWLQMCCYCTVYVSFYFKSQQVPECWSRD
jgi:hypothetical protein